MTSKPTQKIARAIIAPDRIMPFVRRHPWVFERAITRVQGNPADGDLIDLISDGGEFLARGYWNSQSQIRAHILSWDEGAILDDTWWGARLERAINARALFNAEHKAGKPVAYRLVNAENDALPGLVVDRYGDFLVLQALTKGIDARKEMIVNRLNDLLRPAGIYERSDVDIRIKEGLQPATGVLAGDEPPPHIEITENGRRFLVDVHHGHKTGFYLDQRDNRELLRDWLRADPERTKRSILNCFSYSGGFGVFGMHGQAAHVVNVDSSGDALALAKRNYKLNDARVNDVDFVEGDVFQVLRKYRTDGQQFDGVILDPPKFAHSQKQVESATRGYKDINLLAFQLIKPGGFLMTFSCSGLIDMDLFQKVVFGALVDSGREAQIVQRLGQAGDHPVALNFPEGQYLKGLLCRVW
jgi:23S rRNA (cytosine1962-C5)-methyltransferase